MFVLQRWTSNIYFAVTGMPFEFCVYMCVVALSNLCSTHTHTHLIIYIKKKGINYMSAIIFVLFVAAYRY